MKISLLLLSFVCIILFFSTVAPQNKSKLEPLAENVTLEETQRWLEKQIKKFSKHTSNDTFRVESTKIQEIKFEGCKLSYQRTKTIISEARKLPTDSTSAETSSSPSNLENISTVFFLELKKMDETKVFYQASMQKEMKTIVIYTLEKTNVVTFRNDPTNSRYGEGRGSTVYKTDKKEGSQNYASFTVKEEVAEQIKNGFIQAIKLCRTVN